tara:strand:- start:87 stop:611 length:525 start_codon:yes stop_codon:yes gene_type:complete
MKKKIVYFDMDGVLCKFRKKFKEEIEKNPKIQFPQATYGFFENLEPHDYMVALYKALAKNDAFDVHILTAPSYMNPMCYTGKRVWVEKHLGLEAAERMVITGYKNLLKGDYLIDDNASGKGQDMFEGNLLLVHENEHNNNDGSVIEILEVIRQWQDIDVLKRAFIDNSEFKLGK